jgi:hypothetical protein
MDGNHELATEIFGLLVDAGIAFRIKDDLSNAGAVTQIHKHELTVITSDINPSGQGDFFALILGR